MSLTEFATPDRCPACGGSLAAISLISRRSDQASGVATESPLKYALDAEGDRMAVADSQGPRGTVKAFLCNDCRRIQLYGMPIALEAPKNVVGLSRSTDEPLRLEKEHVENQPLVVVDQSGLITIVRLMVDRLRHVDERVYHQLTNELATAVESCHARVVLDLGWFVPTYHSSAFVTTMIRFKRRWLERHVAPLVDKGDPPPPSENQQGGPRPASQPSVRQLSFPVATSCELALQRLSTATEGTSEVILCHVHRTLLDVLKVTRLVRTNP